MATLTDDQLEYLEHHKIPISRVCDASGLSTKQYKSEMEGLGFELAIGVSPCTKAGHTMRFRSGHCAQCNPHMIAFRRRYQESANVYIAFSLGGCLVKVGFAKDLTDRERSLNYFGYGGFDDWEIVCSKHCERAGVLEYMVHKSLSEYAVTRTYIKQGAESTCQELFDCEVSEAESALHRQYWIMQKIMGTR